jgi:hypothetical protein
VTTPRARRATGIVAGAVLAVGAALALSTVLWAGAWLGAQRLLPGTTVAGVEVGGMEIADARAAAWAAMDETLDRIVTLTHDDRRWRVTPRMLGGEQATRAAFETALASARSPSWIETARAGWVGGAPAVARDVAVVIMGARSVTGRTRGPPSRSALRRLSTAACRARRRALWPGTTSSPSGVQSMRASCAGRSSTSPRSST